MRGAVRIWDDLAVAGLRSQRWTIVFAVGGVVLLVVAGLLAQSSVTAEVDVVAGTSVTVDCGTALDARGLPSGAYVNGDEEIEFTDENDLDVLRNLGSTDLRSVLADADDACRDAGNTRVLIAGAVGLLGLVGVVVAVLRLVRRPKAPPDLTVGRT